MSVNITPAETAAEPTAPAPRPVHVATVVREYDDTDTHAAATKEEALAWIAGALFLVEEGIVDQGDPTLTLDEMNRHARNMGWTISLTSHNV